MGPSTSLPRPVVKSRICRFAVPLHVRFGSLADICSAKRHVRFTPNADMCAAPADVRFVPEADIRLLDDLVGASDQGRGNSQSDCARSFQVDDQLELRRLDHREIGWFL